MKEIDESKEFRDYVLEVYEYLQKEVQKYKVSGLRHPYVLGLVEEIDAEDGYIKNQKRLALKHLYESGVIKKYVIEESSTVLRKPSGDPSDCGDFLELEVATIEVNETVLMQEGFSNFSKDIAAKIRLSDYKLTFDDELASLKIGDFKQVEFPPYKNGHYILRVMFSKRKNECIDWEELYKAMNGTESSSRNKVEISKHRKSVKDSVFAINKRVREILETDSTLLLWEQNCVKRLH